MSDYKFENIDKKVKSSSKGSNPFKSKRRESNIPHNKEKRVTYFPVLSIFTIIFAAVVGLLSGFVGDQFSQYLVRQDNNLQAKEETIQQINITNSVEEESAVIDVARDVSDSVVSIVVYKEVSAYTAGGLFEYLFPDGSTDQEDATTQQISAGTGFVATSDGYILTNKHVIDSEGKFVVVFNDGEQVEATLVDEDVFLDIAVLKVDTDKELKPVTLANSENVKVGQTVVAIGNSLGEFTNTVSKGIVSGLARSIIASDGNGQNPEKLDNVIQTDASINPGNSGGPLLDISGNVIGVNVAKSNEGENIGFAIPINAVKPVLESIIKNGEIIRPFLGIMYTELNPTLAKSNDLTVDYGAWINAIGTEDSAIVKDSPAERSGLKDGDIIIALNNQRIDQKKTLKDLIQNHNVGDTIELKVIRDGEELVLEAVLAKYEK